MISPQRGGVYRQVTLGITMGPNCGNMRASLDYPKKSFRNIMGPGLLVNKNLKNYLSCDKIVRNGMKPHRFRQLTHFV